VADRSVVVRLRAIVTDYEQKFRQAAKTASDALQRNHADVDTLSTKLGIVGAGLTGVAALAVKKFAEFDSAVAGVKATGDDAAQSIGALRDLALDAGARTVYSATEAANAIEEMTKAGVSAKDVLSGGLDGALDLAAAGQLDVAQAAEIASTTMNQFSLAGEDVTHIADVLAASAGKANGEVSDFGLAMKYVGPVASQLGVSLEETSGTLALLAQNGILADSAGTGLRGVMMSLTAPTKIAQKAMDEYGIAAFDAQGQFVGLSSLAGQLHDKLGGLTEAERSAALGRMFGNEQITTARILYQEGATAIQDWTQQVDDSGYAAEVAATKLDTLAGDWEGFTGALDTALIGAGEGANGPLRSLVQSATDAVNAFSDLPPAVQQGTLMLVGGAGLVALGVAGLGKLVVGTRDSVQAMKDLGLVSDTTTGKVGRGMRRAAVGIGVASTAMGVFAVAAQLAGTGMDDLADAGRIGDQFEGLAAGSDKARQNLESMFTVAGSSGADLKGLDTAMRALDQNGFVQFLDKAGGLFGVFDTETGLAQAAVEQFDAALAAAVASGNTEDVAAALDYYKEAAAAAGVETETAMGWLTKYGEAADAASVAQDQLQGSTEELTPAQLEEKQATEEATKALEDWRDMVSEAYQSFIDLGGVYQGVIDKNRELAEHIAKDTASAEDSWEDYYDGVSVSASDYIGQLEAQVQAQEAWASNMSELSGRLAEKMPADMQFAAQAMIDELVELGPEGAAQVQLLHDMSDEELAKVVELYDRKGAASAGAFVSEVESHRDPIINVQDDASEKIAAVREQLLKLPDNTTIKVTTDTRVTGPGMTTGGVPWGDGEGAGWTGKLPRGVAQMSRAVKSMDPMARITSGYRPGAITATGHPSYHGMGRAIDIVSPNMGRTWDLLRRAFGSKAKELYYTPRGFVRNGRLTNDVAAVTKRTHFSHVHLALASGGRLPGHAPANPREDNLLGVDEHGMPLARVRSREWVVNQPASDYYGDRFMGAINRKAIPREAVMALPGLANGGFVGAASVPQPYSRTAAALGSSGQHLDVTASLAPGAIGAALDGMSMTLLVDGQPIRAIVRAEAADATARSVLAEARNARRGGKRGW
jgi:TP901 family phage tail tape measure protein